MTTLKYKVSNEVFIQDIVRELSLSGMEILEYTVDKKNNLTTFSVQLKEKLPNSSLNNKHEKRQNTNS